MGGESNSEICQNCALNGIEKAVFTDVNGIAQIGGLVDLGNGVGQMPSGFYVIDVNVPENFFDGETFVDLAINEDFGQDFPDRPVSCTLDDGGPNDSDNIVGTITILSVLPQIGGAGFTGGSIGVFVEDFTVGGPVGGITITLTGFDFFGNTVGPINDITSALGEAEFTGLTPGDYAISFAGDATFQPADTFAFMPPGFTGFIDVFLPLFQN